MSRDLDDPRPLYLRVADDLRDAVERGDYKMGDRLPSQSRLVDLYGVSTMTVKHALELLKRDQTVVPRQGLGVYVRGPARRTKGTHAQLDDLRVRVEHLEAQVHAIESRGSKRRKP
ncbi:MAG: GntR family transcriptional regulator [Nocardioidaceae bacterium]